MRAIYFDLDGTLNRFYEVDNWLEKLHAEDVSPYVEALPIVDFIELRDVLNEFIAAGITIGVISWGAMNGSRDYCKRTRKAKKDWCDVYFPDVFTEFHVVKYSTPKHQVAKIKDSILVDDDDKNLTSWKNGDTIDAKEDIIKALKELLKEVCNGTC